MNFFKAVITVLASFFPSVHAAHVLFKGQDVCSSGDENIKNIYDNILCFHPLSSTEEINEAISKKYPEYSVHFISDTLYAFHNVIMYDQKVLGQKDWENFNLKKYFHDWPCQIDVNELINCYYSGKGPSRADFWSKINQSFLYEFGLIQDYFAKNDAFKKTAQEVWESYETLRKKDKDKLESPFLRRILGALKNLDKKIFEKVCELEEESDQKIVLTRGTGGIGGGIDSTKKGEKVKSLSFGTGLFQAIYTKDSTGSSLHYVKSSYFYAVPVDKKNTSNIFLPKVNPLVSMNSGGEWHPRTFLHGTYGAVIPMYGHSMGFYPTSEGVKLRPDFCCDASSLAQEKFHNHADWTVLIHAVPLKNEREFFDTAFTQLKNLYEGDLETKEERKKDFIEFLKKYEQTYSEEVGSSDSEEECPPEVKTYRTFLETGVTEAERVEKNRTEARLAQRKQNLEEDKQYIFRSYNNLIEKENDDSAESCLKINTNSMILGGGYRTLLQLTELVIISFQEILPEDLGISRLRDIKSSCEQKLKDLKDLKTIQGSKEDDFGHKKLKKDSEEK